MNNKINIYIAPFNEIGKKLLKQLDKNRYEFLGFIDNFKKSPNTIKPKDITKVNYDQIIIASNNYFQEIYEQLLKVGISKDKIVFYIKYKNSFAISIEEARQYYTIDHFISKKRQQESEKFFKSLKNIYKDRSIFLIGNGPSLKIKDLDKLKDKITFAANKIYLAYEDTKWRPTYYLVEDDLVYKQNNKKIKELKDSIKLFPVNMLQSGLVINDGWYFNLIYNLYDKNFPNFNPNPLERIYWGSTVIYTMIQWAVYFGVKKIYLLGVDFDFNIPKKFQKKQIIISQGESNHFHKEYRKKGELWNKPNLHIQYKTFLKAQEYAEQNNISIINLSRKTKLDIFPVIDFDEFFKTK